MLKELIDLLGKQNNTVFKMEKNTLFCFVFLRKKANHQHCFITEDDAMWKKNMTVRDSGKHSDLEDSDFMGKVEENLNLFTSFSFFCVCIKNDIS